LHERRRRRRRRRKARMMRVNGRHQSGGLNCYRSLNLPQSHALNKQEEVEDEERGFRKAPSCDLNCYRSLDLPHNHTRKEKEEEKMEERRFRQRNRKRRRMIMKRGEGERREG
jgi:hypothetical protein